MKITAYNPEHHIDLSGSVGTVAYSIAKSTTSLGSNTPKIESGSGSPGSGPQAAAWDHVHPEFGGASSFGSNSTRVSSTPAAGASSSNSRADHVHDGIGTITASSSNTLNRGTFNLRAGTGIALALSNTDGGSGFDTVTIQNLVSGGGGSGTLTVEEVDGSPTVAATKLVFPNTTLSVVGTVVTYTPAGGGGLTIQYPSLKPATPTYDFASASLDGAFSAHSSGGTFATTSCMTQGADPWPGSTLEMQFSAQMGRLTLAHSNTDLDFTWGGVVNDIGEGANSVAFGIAAINSSGDGICVLSETNDLYFGKLVAYQFTTVLSSTGSGRGANTTQHMQSGALWFRLKRISGTWTGYASASGRTWDKTFATDATSYTVDRLAFGLFYNTAATYYGRVLSDFIQVDA